MSDIAQGEPFGVVSLPVEWGCGLKTVLSSLKCAYREQCLFFLVFFIQDMFAPVLLDFCSCFACLFVLCSLLFSGG